MPPLINIKDPMIFNGINSKKIEKLKFTQVFSISFWVNPAKFNQDWAEVFDYRHKQDKSFAFHKLPGYEGRYAFGIHSKIAVHGVYVNLISNSWQHITITKSENLLSIYLNGRLHEQKIISNLNNIDYAGDEILTLGDWGYGGRNWEGSLSCFMVFSYPLDVQQAADIGSANYCKPK